MIKNKFFTLILLLLYQNCSANIFSTLPASCLDYVKENKVALAGGFALGALTVGCVWYYNHYKKTSPTKTKIKSQIYKKKEKHAKKVLEHIEIPYMFDGIETHDKEIFINFLKNQKSSFHFIESNLESPEKKDVAIILIRDESRPGDTLMTYRKDKLPYYNIKNPIFIFLTPFFLESQLSTNFKNKPQECAEYTVFKIEFLDTIGLTREKFKVPETEYNLSARKYIIEKLNTLFSRQ